MESDEGRHSAANEEDEGAVRRRAAMKRFLQAPEEAGREYQDLISELQEFFIYSSNPYEDEATGGARYNREELYEQWLAAKQWAQGHSEQE